MSTEVLAPTGSDADKHKDLGFVKSDGTMMESSPEPIEAEAGIQARILNDSLINAGITVFTTLITMRKDKKEQRHNYQDSFSTAIHSDGMNAGNIKGIDVTKCERASYKHKVKSKYAIFTSPTFEGEIFVNVYHDLNKTMNLDESIDRSKLKEGLWIPKLEVLYIEKYSDVDYTRFSESVTVDQVYNVNHRDKEAIIKPRVQLILRVRIKTGGWGDDINIRQVFHVDMSEPRGNEIRFENPTISRS